MCSTVSHQHESGILKLPIVNWDSRRRKPEAKAVFAYAAYRGLLQLAYESPAVLPENWVSYSELVLQALLPSPGPKRRSRKKHK